VKCILRYLRGTASHGLHITRSSFFALHGFTDADWADSVEDRKSMGGYLVFFGQKIYASVNKPINLHYFYSCIHIFIFLFFYFFIFF
jgi:hypothetical protein